MTGTYVFISVEELTKIIDSVLQTRLNQFKPIEEEKLLSPKEARKVWDPAISLVTLDKWCNDGLLKPHWYGGRKYFKRSEIIEAAKVLLPYKK